MVAQLRQLASAATESRQLYANKHFIKLAARLLGSPACDVREQPAWALGKIAGDSPASHDAVLGAGALAPLCSLAQATLLRVPLSLWQPTAIAKLTHLMLLWQPVYRCSATQSSCTNNLTYVALATNYTYENNCINVALATRLLLPEQLL